MSTPSPLSFRHLTVCSAAASAWRTQTPRPRGSGPGIGTLPHIFRGNSGEGSWMSKITCWLGGDAQCLREADCLDESAYIGRRRESGSFSHWSDLPRQSAVAGIRLMGSIAIAELCLSLESSGWQQPHAASQHGGRMRTGRSAWQCHHNIQCGFARPQPTIGRYKEMSAPFRRQNPPATMCQHLASQRRSGSCRWGNQTKTQACWPKLRVTVHSRT